MAASPKKRPPSKGKPQGRRPSHKAKSPTSKVKVQKKTKVSKKPKHLGRKLATANDVTEQERIRKQMELLEATKRSLSSQKKTNPTEKKDQTKDDFAPGGSTSQSAKKQQQPKSRNEQRTVAPANSLRVTTSSTKENNGVKLSSNKADSTASKDAVPKHNATPRPDTKSSKPQPPDSRSSAKPTTLNTEAATKGDGEIQNDSEIVAAPVGRQRGKRRRGRKDTSQIVGEEQQQAKPSAKEVTTAPDTKDVSPPKPRRCLGRKPITDFEVGETYSGTVVYAKPFGIFIDIGCHSDAFCHVSRLADTFVKDPLPLFPPGTEIPSLRIVQVDRDTQRITGSLQTEARMAEELASAQARQQRKERHRLQKQQEQQNLEKRRNKKLQQQQLRSDSAATSDPTTTAPSPKKHRTLEPSASSQTDDTASHLPATSHPQDDDKRARKLARRAARRAAKEGRT